LDICSEARNNTKKMQNALDRSHITLPWIDKNGGGVSIEAGTQSSSVHTKR
jgi:hypothetical protein